MASQLWQMLQNQPTIGQQTTAMVGDRAQRDDLRRQNRLGELLQPIKEQIAPQQMQQQFGDEQRQRLGQAATVFRSALGTDYAQLPPEQQSQRWMAAKGAAQQAGFDLSPLPDQPDQRWLNIADKFSMGAAGGYGKQLVPVRKPDGSLALVQASESGGVAEIGGYTPVALAPEAKAQLDIQTTKGKEEAKYDVRIDKGAAAEGSKQAGAQAVKMSGDALEQLGGVRQNIDQLNEVVSLIDQGAQSGVIASRLPSVTEASKSLDNLQRRMGLNVVQNTTFGALSEGELKLALDTALPTRKDPEYLRQWAIDRRDAQQKLSNYLEEAAIFLGTPGNTPAKWLEVQRSRQKAASMKDASTEDLINAL